jgi:hypothetical protein
VGGPHREKKNSLATSSTRLRAHPSAVVGSIFFTTEKSAPDNLGLLQQYRHIAVPSEFERMSAAGGSGQRFRLAQQQSLALKII